MLREKGERVYVLREERKGGERLLIQTKSAYSLFSINKAPRAPELGKRKVMHAKALIFGLGQLDLLFIELFDRE